MTSGTLTVKPLSGKLKRDTETFGKMDPYCKVKLGSTTHETKVHSNAGKYPAWNDKLVFKRSNEEVVNIDVLDKDTFSSDTIGYVTIPLSKVVENKKVSEWHTLSYKGKMAGEILVEMEFIPDAGSSGPSTQQFSGTSVMMGSQQPQYVQGFSQ